MFYIAHFSTFVLDRIKATLLTFLSSVVVSGSWTGCSGAPLNTPFQFLECSVAPEGKQTEAIFRRDIYSVHGDML